MPSQTYNTTCIHTHTHTHTHTHIRIQNNILLSFTQYVFDIIYIKLTISKIIKINYYIPNRFSVSWKIV
jgi:hypothetical protein